jgi:hypothetical protein
MNLHDKDITLRVRVCISSGYGNTLGESAREVSFKFNSFAEIRAKLAEMIESAMKESDHYLSGHELAHEAGELAGIKG